MEFVASTTTNLLGFRRERRISFAKGFLVTTIKLTVQSRFFSYLTPYSSAEGIEVRKFTPAQFIRYLGGNRCAKFLSGNIQPALSQPPQRGPLILPSAARLALPA